MNLVYIADSVIPSRAANSIQVMRMCGGFAKAGHRTTLVVRRLPGRELLEDPFLFYGLERTFEILKLDGRGSSGKSVFAWRAAAWVLRTRPDLVYSRSLAACAFCGLLGIPVIYESHTPERGFKGTRAYPVLLRTPGLRRHIVVSEALKRHYVTQRGASDELVRVVPNGYDMPGDSSPTRAPAPASSPVPLFPPGGRDGSLRVGYVGHLYEGRGIALVLELARRVPEAGFHLVGGTKDDVERWRRRSRLPNVTFHGFCPPAQVQSVQQTFDVLLAPYETSVFVDGCPDLDTAQWMSPLKMFEYLASGKPVIASRLPAIEEIVEDGRSAVLCAPEKPDHWEAALRRLMSSPRSRERIGREGQKLLASRFTLRKRVERVLEGLA